jgi:hypothetical protein
MPAGPAPPARACRGREAAAELALGDLGRRGGRSTSTQWKKSTRGRSAGISRPGWFTSSAALGTSKSWQISTSELRAGGRSLQARCGLRLSPKVRRPAPSGGRRRSARGCGRRWSSCRSRASSVVSWAGAVREEGQTPQTTGSPAAWQRRSMSTIGQSRWRRPTAAAGASDASAASSRLARRLRRLVPRHGGRSDGRSAARHGRHLDDAARAGSRPSTRSRWSPWACSMITSPVALL